LLAAADVRKITAFLAVSSHIGQGTLPRGSTQRRTKAFSTWRPSAPGANAVPGPDPPDTA
jgi:hypothetical protein